VKQKYYYYCPKTVDGVGKHTRITFSAALTFQQAAAFLS
jgi:hypothetical protein